MSFAHLRGWLGVSHGPGSRSHGAASPSLPYGCGMSSGLGPLAETISVQVKENATPRAPECDAVWKNTNVEK